MSYRAMTLYRVPSSRMPKLNDRGLSPVPFRARVRLSNRDRLASQHPDPKGTHRSYPSHQARKINLNGRPTMVFPMLKQPMLRRSKHLPNFGRLAASLMMTQMYGPAVRCKRFWSRCRLAVLHQCIRPLIGARHAPGHDGNQRACDLISGQASCWAIWVTSVRMRREDRTSISFHPLADLGG
jgi:hypothetical protein